MLEKTVMKNYKNLPKNKMYKVVKDEMAKYLNRKKLINTNRKITNYYLRNYNMRFVNERFM